tara:strand:- start:336 stop:488 length:153 start_codon:yes stop_codon:yes gene_type:complete
MQYLNHNGGDRFPKEHRFRTQDQGHTDVEKDRRPQQETRNYLGQTDLDIE